MFLSVGQHDNVVGWRGLCKKGSDMYIVLEYCPRGTLDVMVHQTMSARWDLRKVLQIVKGIARGMFHLHTRRPPILHRDIKPGELESVPEGTFVQVCIAVVHQILCFVACFLTIFVFSFFFFILFCFVFVLIHWQ